MGNVLDQEANLETDRVDRIGRCRQRRQYTSAPCLPRTINIGHVRYGLKWITKCFDQCFAG
jgi:hypothetical protein